MGLIKRFGSQWSELNATFVDIDNERITHVQGVTQGGMLPLLNIEFVRFSTSVPPYNDQPLPAEDGHSRYVELDQAKELLAIFSTWREDGQFYNALSDFLP